MDITIQVLGTCSSGGHIRLRATIDGTTTRDFTVMRSQLADTLSEVDPVDALVIILRNHVKEQGISTPAQIKTYVEGHIFKW